MGVFDWVYVEHDLPDKKVDSELEFQSKSPKLDHCCVEYRIKDDGRLMKRGNFEKFSGGFEIHGKTGEYYCTFEKGILKDILPNDRTNPVQEAIDN